MPAGDAFDKYMQSTQGGTSTGSSQNFGANVVIGGSGNQAGPGGPGSDTYNPNLSAQNQLQAIVDSKQDLQNQAGTPAYADPTHKFYKFMQVPQGGQPTQAQLAIADFYLPSTPNAYQQAIQNFIQSNPVNAQVFKERFPITASLNSLMQVPEKILSKSPLVSAATGILNALSNTGATQNAFASISDAYVQGKQMTEDVLGAGMNAVNTGMSAADDALGKGVDIFQDAIAPTVKEPKFKGSQSTQVASPLSGIPSLLNTSTDTAGVERLFKLPPGSGLGFGIYDLNQIPPQNTGQTGNYLVRDPSIRTPFIKNQLTGMNLNQGGLASLNNPDYGMLMNASNFGF